MKSGKILLVEDECVNAAMIEHQLKKLGYTIAGIARSGEEAIELAEQLKPDLVLMDINLNGEMDGVEAARIVHGTRAVPIIFLTATSDERTIDRAVATEAHGYLLKPVHERELHSAVQMALYKGWVDASVRTEKLWLSATLRYVTDGVIAADASGAVKFTNLAAERLTGWTEQNALNRDLYEVYEALDPETCAPAEFAITQLIKEDRLAGVTSRKVLVSRQGVETRIEQHATLITTENGEITGVVFVFRPSTGPPARPN